MIKDFDVIVIGAGAAGLMCASEAGKRGRRVCVLEHAAKIGKKILISGGGRCNFTNLNTAPENYLSENPHFCKSALTRYTAQDFVAMVKRHRISYHEKKLGQLFCDDSARRIVEMLETECRNAKVEIYTNCTVRSVKQNPSNETAKQANAKEAKSGYTVETEQGIWRSESLVIATGGVSIPKMGATDFGYKIARQFGLRMTQVKPALVPLTWSSAEADKWSNLSGVSFPASVAVKQAEFDESVLLTHKGLSGPAVLQISSYWNGRDAIRINLLPHTGGARDFLLRHRESGSELISVLSQAVPRRLAQAWCAKHDLPSKPMHRFSLKELERIAARLDDWYIQPHGTEGFAKAEVTLGGVCTKEISSQTMASKRVAGLYFVGEVLDVTGHLGGYNFQWAWSSGFVAGQYV